MDRDQLLSQYKYIVNEHARDIYDSPNTQLVNYIELLQEVNEDGRIQGGVETGLCYVNYEEDWWEQTIDKIVGGDSDFDDEDEFDEFQADDNPTIIGGKSVTFNEIHYARKGGEETPIEEPLRENTSYEIYDKKEGRILFQDEKDDILEPQEVDWDKLNKYKQTTGIIPSRSNIPEKTVVTRSEVRRIKRNKLLEELRHLDEESRTLENLENKFLEIKERAAVPTDKPEETQESETSANIPEETQETEAPNVPGKSSESPVDIPEETQETEAPNIPETQETESPVDIPEETQETEAPNVPEKIQESPDPIYKSEEYPVDKTQEFSDPIYKSESPEPIDNIPKTQTIPEKTLKNEPPITPLEIPVDISKKPPADIPEKTREIETPKEGMFNSIKQALMKIFGSKKGGDFKLDESDFDELSKLAEDYQSFDISEFLDLEKEDLEWIESV